jgi:Flp pilus assembly protein TadG
MHTNLLVDRLLQTLARFRRSEGGNVVFMFALATIPMIGFVGAAVDYSRANSAKSAMQAAADSTALMLSREATGLNSSQMNTKAQSFFTALLHRPEVTGITVSPNFTNPTAGSFKLVLSASGTVPTSFTKVFGQSSLNISVTSEVVWGMKKLELALALDNTGSMDSNNKMTELKKAAKSLLTTLKNAAKSDADIKVSIIPFAKEVNVGTGNASATWLRWTEWEAANGGSGGGGSGGFCIFGICWNGSSWVPQGSSSGSSNHSSWNGCVMDRDQDYDVLDTAPSTSIQATLFPAKQADDCPVSLLPLTPIYSQQSTLVSKIDSMTPVGSTNVTIGLAWAWHAVTTNSPLTEALAPNLDTDKVIILLTDGENTDNRWGQSSTQIDERTKKVCDNIKAANIKIYTIRVIDGNTSLLTQCASKPDMFFNVSSASQLNGVFTAIAQNLARLRIAK